METVFSGIQPSGELHFGNYLGAIKNWVRVQDAQTDSKQDRYHCYYCIVDYHAITQNYDPEILSRRTLEMAIDLLACGINPDKSVLFVQSAVPEHTELAWILSSVAGYGELQRMTQFKDKSEHQGDNINVGLFTYPVLQTSDIVLYKAKRVPVGQDQLQHLELAREIVRKFNRRYGDVFPEPEALLSETPKLLGLDGQAKMSKSMGNTISLGEDEDSMWEKLRTAATDPARVRLKDPGDPEKCNIYTLHKFFSNEEDRAWVREGCTTASMGCIPCKQRLFDRAKEHLAPIRDKRNELASKPERVKEMLHAGATAARKVAQETVREARDKLGLHV